MAKKPKVKNKKPIFKRWWFWLIVAIIIIGAVGGGSKKEDPQPETEIQTEAPTEAVTEVQTEAPTEAVELSEKEQIEKTIRDRIISEYTMTDIDSITINDDAGTETDGDYIALVNLTWNQKNDGKKSKEVLSLYSSDLAATLGAEVPSVNEVAIFWTVPYLNANAKCSYQRSGEGFAEMDMVWGKEFE